MINTNTNTKDTPPVIGQLDFPKGIKRLDDWALRLSEFLADCQKEKISCDWEFFNCVSWASAAIEAMTGQDLYANHTDVVDSPAKAWRYIQNLGFKSLEELITTQLPEIPKAFLSRGDIALVPSQILTVGAFGGQESDQQGIFAGNDYSALGMSVAVCLADPPVVWTLTEHGIASIDISLAVRAFAVGDNLCLQQ